MIWLSTLQRNSLGGMPEDSEWQAVSGCAVSSENLEMPKAVKNKLMFTLLPVMSVASLTLPIKDTGKFPLIKESEK